jgi:hypothetical protein
MSGGAGAIEDVENDLEEPLDAVPAVGMGILVGALDIWVIGLAGVSEVLVSNRSAGRCSKTASFEGFPVPSEVGSLRAIIPPGSVPIESMMSSEEMPAFGSVISSGTHRWL